MVRGTQKKVRSLKLVLTVVGFLVALGLTMGIFFYTHPSWVGEQAGDANYVHRTLGLISDLPHMSGELFYDTIENGIGLVVIYFIAQTKLRKEHADFDREHGIHHD